MRKAIRAEYIAGHLCNANKKYNVKKPSTVDQLQHLLDNEAKLPGAFGKDCATFSKWVRPNISMGQKVNAKYLLMERHIFVS